MATYARRPSDFAIEIDDELESLLRSRAGSPDLLYHYTTIQAAHSILEARSARLYNVLTSNDEEEITHSVDLTKECLQELRGDLDMPSNLIDRLISELSRWSAYYEFFALSFVARSESQSADELGLWRAYGDDGNGCALVFKRQRLEQLAKRSDTHLLPVTYDLATKREILKNASQLLVRKFREASAMGFEEDDESAEKFITFAAMGFQILICAFKNPHFREECEWRLVRIAGSGTRDPRFFDQNNRPYISVGLLPEPEEGDDDGDVVGALVGPSKQRNSHAVSIKSRLRASGFDEFVRVSTIPYRGRG